MAAKNERKVARKEGKTDEQEADPMQSSLCQLIYIGAVCAGIVFMWVRSLATWNFMS